MQDEVDDSSQSRSRSGRHNRLPRVVTKPAVQKKVFQQALRGCLDTLQKTSSRLPPGTMEFVLCCSVGAEDGHSVLYTVNSPGLEVRSPVCCLLGTRIVLCLGFIVLLHVPCTSL